MDAAPSACVMRFGGFAALGGRPQMAVGYPGASQRDFLDFEPTGSTPGHARAPTIERLGVADQAIWVILKMSRSFTLLRYPQVVLLNGFV